jgi:hypothetical protein
MVRTKDQKGSIVVGIEKGPVSYAEKKMVLSA